MSQRKEGRKEERETFLLGEFNFFLLFCVYGQSQIFKIWSNYRYGP